jgi:hypothetical protein
VPTTSVKTTTAPATTIPAKPTNPPVPTTAVNTTTAPATTIPAEFRCGINPDPESCTSNATTGDGSECDTEIFKAECPVLCNTCINSVVITVADLDVGVLVAEDDEGTLQNFADAVIGRVAALSSKIEESDVDAVIFPAVAESTAVSESPAERENRRERERRQEPNRVAIFFSVDVEPNTVKLKFKDEVKTSRIRVVQKQIAEPETVELKQLATKTITFDKEIAGTFTGLATFTLPVEPTGVAYVPDLCGSEPQGMVFQDDVAAGTVCDGTCGIDCFRTTLCGDFAIPIGQQYQLGVDSTTLCGEGCTEICYEDLPVPTLPPDGPPNITDPCATLSGTVAVDRINDNPGILSCECVPENDACFDDNECVAEPACFEQLGTSGSGNVEGSGFLGFDNTTEANAMVRRSMEQLAHPVRHAAENCLTAWCPLVLASCHEDAACQSTFALGSGNRERPVAEMRRDVIDHVENSHISNTWVCFLDFCIDGARA